MTITISSGPRQLAPVADMDSGVPRARRAGRRLRPGAAHGWLSPAAVLSRPGWAGSKDEQSGLPASAPGAIGGAVVRAARRSAGLTRRTLARRLAVTPATVRAWENGMCPLYCVSYHQLRQLAGVLGQGDARTGLCLADMVLASQCDLLVTGMLGGFEDYAEVPPADLESEGEAARGLLRWALTGDVPDRYRAFARSGPLLARRDAAAFTALAQELADGAAGQELTSYGAALLAVAAS